MVEYITSDYFNLVFIDSKSNIINCLEFVQKLQYESTPVKTKKLRSCNAVVCTYDTNVGVVHLLKVDEAFIAMVNVSWGYGYDFIGCTNGNTPVNKRRITKFFNDYLEEGEDVFVYTAI